MNGSDAVEVCESRDHVGKNCHDEWIDDVVILRKGSMILDWIMIAWRAGFGAVVVFRLIKERFSKPWVHEILLTFWIFKKLASNFS